MASLIRPWVTQTKRRAVFSSIPEIAGLHPKLVQIYGELVAARPPEGAASAELRAVIEDAALADVVHDALARAVYSGLVAERAYALATKPPALDRAQRTDAASARLFPDGLAIVNASLLAESGNTARVAELLEREPSIAALLEAIPVQGFGDLLVVTRRWIAAGKRLAKLEEAREDLEADQVTTPLGNDAINRLRARWIRLVSQVVSLLELSDADPSAVARIRNPILKASSRAGKRYGVPVTADEALADAEDDDEGDADVEPAPAAGT